jgi:hypothetical protein
MLRIVTIMAFTLLTIGSPEVLASDQTAIGDETIEAAVEALVAAHGDEAATMADWGVRQVAVYWRAEDGDVQAFTSFCQANLVVESEGREALLRRFDKNFEGLYGHQKALRRLLREPTDLEGEHLPVDSLFATLDPFDHLTDDLFASKVAFVILLNFRQVPLEELIERGDEMSRQEWAEARLARSVSLRIPGEVRQAETAAFAGADEYISSYNIRMDRLVTEEGERPFPEGLTLISHWGLRDELKAMYSDPQNLAKQELILEVMYRIVRQEIPAEVVNNGDLDWAVVSNRVAPHQASELDWAAFKPATREPDTRYAQMLSIFEAERAVDAHSPAWPTHIDRSFAGGREIPEDDVRELFTEVVSARQAKRVGKVISKRLGRKLTPFDIWYDGFKSRSAIPEAELTKKTQELYPDAEAFDAAIPAILEELGFSSESASYLGSKIDVDASRGAGHAMNASMRSDNAHLRTRISAGGMDYKGYNIGVHELGHNVEQVLSLNRVDWVLLAGVPSSGFSEAFAFTFQYRDLDLLGRGGEKNSIDEADAVLDRFWTTMELSAVSLVDMRVWRWMYAHPEATPAELREAVVAIAIEVWNSYYAPVIGVRDSPILAIYSHMIELGLYLPEYPIGFLIQHQIEEHIEGKELGPEMERMATQGSLTPDAWMQGAVGGSLSAEPLLDSVDEALRVVR